jgi:hypothetical protein
MSRPSSSSCRTTGAEDASHPRLNNQGGRHHVRLAFSPQVGGRHRCVHQRSFHRQPGDQEPDRFRLHRGRIPRQSQRGRGPRHQSLQVDPGLPGQHRCGAHGHPGQVCAPGGGRLREESGQAHHHQLRRLLGNRRRRSCHRKGLSGDSPAVRHPYSRTELPGNHQQRRRDPRLLQLHLHEAGAGLHLHRRPERRGRRGRSPGVRADGGGHPHLCLQRECRRCQHPRNHALSGGR